MNGLVGYWPWWIGAVALGGVTFGFYKALGAPLGVSGSWSRVVARRDLGASAEEQALATADAAAIEAALMAATLAEFGEAALATEDDATAVGGATALFRPAMAWTAHATFLAMLAVGGFVAALAGGTAGVRRDMGADFARLLGSGWRLPCWLLAGGLLVGFGTRMCGGCSSGHGLSGCSRLHPSSLAGTAAFFATGALVSLSLAWVHG